MSADVFANMFGGMRRRRPDPNAPRRGHDLKFVVDVPLSMFIIGGHKETTVSYDDVCQDCSGKGASKLEPCDRCHGTGHTEQTIRHQNGIMTTMITCSSCQGRGEVPKDVCTVCEGKGIISIIDREVSFDLGAGHHIDGDIVRSANKGGKGINGGPDGDMYIKMRMVLPNKDDLTEEQLKVLEEL
jgi:molecular chaperone DnaJ